MSWVKQHWFRIGLFIAAIGTVLVLGLFIREKLRHKTPDEQAARATADLVRMSNNLQKSFGSSQNSSAATSHYVVYLGQMQHDCDAIAKAKDTAQEESDNATISRINNSADLCVDLSKLISDSLYVYQPLVPLLETTAQPKTYQTLPLFSASRRNHHLNVINTAVRSLKGKKQIGDFPTEIPSQLSVLQESAISSHGLSYWLALRDFQNQALAERVQYWMSYGDLDMLRHTLSTQLSAYCSTLATNRVHIGACSASS